MIGMLCARVRAVLFACVAGALGLVAAPSAGAAPCEPSNVGVSVDRTTNYVWTYDPLEHHQRIRFIDFYLTIASREADCAVGFRLIDPAYPNATTWTPGYNVNGLSAAVWLAGGPWGNAVPGQNVAGAMYARKGRNNRSWGWRFTIAVNSYGSQGVPLAGEYSVPLRLAYIVVPIGSPCAPDVTPTALSAYTPKPECPEQTIDIPLVIKFPAAVNPGSFGGVESDGQLQPTQFPDLNFLTKTTVSSTFQANVPYRLTFASANGGILLRDNDPNSRIGYDGKARLTNNGWGTWDVFVIGSKKTRDHLDADPTIGFNKTLILELKIVDKSQGWLAGTYTDTITITVEQLPTTPVPP
ncbi:MAG: hypothetical protein KJS97_10520 [Alphaproteobacteria bacterium]|nr:hypothetical protein [Alphaproteobacteria bacterium]